MNISKSAPKRPGLRYHGAKWQLAPWIIEHLPDEHDLYCEVFGGSAAVLLRKQRSHLEVYNDLDGDVVNYFQVLRDRRDELIETIRFTPFAKREWELAGEWTDDPVEAARRFYVRSYMSIAGPTAQWRTGWRRQKVLTRDGDNVKRMTPAAVSFMRIDHLVGVAERFRGVAIESDTWEGIVDRYDSEHALFYLDPPYMMATRRRWEKTAYRHEMTDDDHERLLLRLLRAQAMVVLSGYQSEMYDTMLTGWAAVERSARVNGPGSRVERLWISPRAWEGLHRNRNLALFGGVK